MCYQISNTLKYINIYKNTRARFTTNIIFLCLGILKLYSFKITFSIYTSVNEKIQIETCQDVWGPGDVPEINHFEQLKDDLQP